MSQGAGAAPLAAGKQALAGELPDAFQLLGTQFFKTKKKRGGRLGGLHRLQRGGFHQKNKKGGAK